MSGSQIDGADVWVGWGTMEWDTSRDGMREEVYTAQDLLVWWGLQNPCARVAGSDIRNVTECLATLSVASMRTSIIIRQELIEMQNLRPDLPDQNVGFNKAQVIFELILAGKHPCREHSLCLLPQHPSLFW